MSPSFRPLSGALLLMSVVSVARAQERACSATGEGLFGLESIDCPQCTVRIQGNNRWIEYGAEPTVRVATQFPSGQEQFRRGDVIVAIDGALITTSAAWERFASPVAGRQVRFTIRRDGRQMDLSITAAACVGAPPTTAIGRGGRGAGVRGTFDSTGRVLRFMTDSLARMNWQFGRNDSTGRLQPRPAPTFARGAGRSGAYFAAPDSGRAGVRGGRGAGRAGGLPGDSAMAWSRGVGAGRGAFTGRMTWRDSLGFARGGRAGRDSTANRFAPTARSGGALRFERDSTGSIRILGRGVQDPAVPGLAANRGWIGFGLDCNGCSAEISDAGERSWHFSSAPAIAGVEPGSPAELAGIHPGDVLLAIDGMSMTTSAGAGRFSSIRAGQHVRFRIARQGKTQEISVTVGRRAN